MPCMDSVFSVSCFHISFGDLSLPCSFSPVEGRRQTLEGGEFEEIVEPYQFGPQASKSLVVVVARVTPRPHPKQCCM